ncbi:MAG TPA: hypothetical protein VFA05_07575 [Gaiellaceae bacterium]|nr:hypothetical protein [Gaiellaceae bacterium]
MTLLPQSWRGVACAAAALLVLTASQASPSAAATATIAARSATTAQNGVAASLSLAVPGTTQPGDVLVAVIDIQYQPTIAAPAGWQLVRQDVNTSGNHLVQAAFVHTAGVSEPASYTWSFSASHGAIGGMIDYTGVDTSSPVEASAGALTVNQLSIAAPSVTTTAAGSLELAAFSVQVDHAITLPSSLSKEFGVAITGVTGEKLEAAAGDRTIAAAGATGALSASVSQSSTGIGQSIALRPASASTGPNQPPVVDSVSVSPASPLTNDVLRAVVAAHDPDGDPLTFSYQWILNGVDLPGATGATLDLSQPGNGDRGDTLAVRVTANDGQASTSPLTSSAVTVGNSPPTASVGLSPTSPTPTSTLTATVQAADADGDPVTLTYVWTVNGTTVRTTVTSQTSDSLDLSSACSCANGDQVAVTVTPNDGTVDGAAASASAVVGGSSSFGNVSEFGVPGMAVPSNLTSGPDGNLWFTEENQPNVARLAIATDALTLFRVPSGQTGLGGIAPGPDGNLWFADTKALKVARLVPSTGQITEFSTPVAANGVVGGSDGNLWFVASGANKILVVSPAGQLLHTYTVPTANSAPHGPALGSDGDVYFAEFNTSKIGRVTPSGTFKQWSLPHTGSRPFQTAFGPDGRLYVTENAGNRIARLTIATGAIAEFAVPTASSAPAGIAAGPDGNLRFAEKNANQLGRLTTAGAITEFPLPAPTNGPDKVVAGSDGNMWFTEQTTAQIGRFSLH